MGEFNHPGSESRHLAGMKGSHCKVALELCSWIFPLPPKPGADGDFGSAEMIPSVSTAVGWVGVKLKLWCFHESACLCKGQGQDSMEHAVLFLACDLAQNS